MWCPSWLCSFAKPSTVLRTGNGRRRESVRERGEYRGSEERSTCALSGGKLERERVKREREADQTWGRGAGGLKRASARQRERALLGTMLPRWHRERFGDNGYLSLSCFASFHACSLSLARARALSRSLSLSLVRALSLARALSRSRSLSLSLSLSLARALSLSRPAVPMCGQEDGQQ